MVTTKPASPRPAQTSVKQMGASTSPTATPRPLSNATILLAGAALAAATVALFMAGFARKPVSSAYHRAMVRAEQIEVPMMFPVTLAETGLQLLTDMRSLPERMGRRS